MAQEGERMELERERGVDPWPRRASIIFFFLRDIGGLVALQSRGYGIPNVELPAAGRIPAA